MSVQSILDILKSSESELSYPHQNSAEYMP